MLYRSMFALMLLVVVAQADISTAADMPEADLAKIRQAAPSAATAKPKKPRKVLIFSRATEYAHESIPWGAQALRIIGEKSGAYTPVLSEDPAMFDRDKLFEFDAVIFNNNCGNPVSDPVRRKNLLDFVRGGRGLVGIHCAAHLDWPEYTDMIGGYSISHPWNAGSTVTIKSEEPAHPLVHCFGDESFEYTDEIFEFDRFSRDKVRVLLSLDTDRTDMKRPKIKRTDGDFALSWIRTYGKGHVFYCALGHQKDVYWRPATLEHYLAGIQFALGDLPADATPHPVSASAGKNNKTLNLVFCCRGDNDLYRVMAVDGKKYQRFDTPVQAVKNAPQGAGLLFLADRYPQKITQIDQQIFEQAAKKKLRLYVEYSASLPDLSVGKTPAYLKTGPYSAIVERTVVTSDAFGPDLKKMRIMAINDCHYLPVEAKSPLLVLARVEGYDTAVYGLSKEVHPILFEHPRGDIMVSTTKLSQFVTARYSPSEAWSPVWRMILGWLQPGREVPTLTWTPTVRPSFGKSQPLPQNAQAQAMRRGVEYYGKSRLYIHPSWPKDKTGIDPLPADWPHGDGSHGIGECYISKRIFADGSQAVNRTIRADCNLEAAMGLACGAVALGESKYGETAKKLGDQIFFHSSISQGVRADPTNPCFGLLGWGVNSEHVHYGDDNARATLSAIATAAMLKSDRWDEAIIRTILANFRTTGPKGFRPARIEGPQLQANGWRHYYNLDFIEFRPHMQSWIWCTYLWLYDKTKYEPFLDRARTGISLMMKAYPNWSLEANRVEQERCRMLLPLAWLVRVEDTPEHRKWLDKIARYVIDLQDASGAIPQIPGHVVTSNENYGTNECALVHETGDPATDALYSINFAFIGMHEAAAATGDVRYDKSASKMADFFIRTQTTSEVHPELDGTWYRGFDFKKWDYWASDGDAGWGVWTNEIGWTHSWITATLALRQMKTSLWEYSADSKIKRHFDKWRRQMLPDKNSTACLPFGKTRYLIEYGRAVSN
ncbi:MAG: ThuA domain-containing protein [Pirellulales bacterium]|nr:ThuA domain-containing protein [Pirellulales bacterium]